MSRVLFIIIIIIIIKIIIIIYFVSFRFILIFILLDGRTKTGNRQSPYHKPAAENEVFY